MADLKRSWLISLILMLLFLFVGQGIAQQQEEHVDPWRYPELTKSKPFQRWWWAFQQRAYPLGYIPEGAKLRALEQIERFKSRLFKSGQRLNAQPVISDRWVNIGPAPILGGQIGSRGNTRPMSGRVADIAVDPSNPNRWLIGAAQGGIWETRDAGATWTPKTDNQASLAMGAIAFAPSNPNIIYAGTGEAVFSADAYAGAGLLKSIDGGNTWTLLATATFKGTAFSDIKVNPTNPNIVVAATTRGMPTFFTPFTPLPARGIFKSTDGGVTWSRKLIGEATDLEIDPGNFNNQYAGIGNNFGGSENGVYRSTNAGDTWTRIDGPWDTMIGGVGRVELAIAPSNPNVLYVSIQDAINSVGNDSRLLGLWRTNNAWAPMPSWIQIAVVPGPGISEEGGWWYNHEIIVDPTNPNIVYLGGVALWKFDGTTWTDVSKLKSDPANGIHQDQHSMAWAGNRLIVGNDGGVWSTTDGGNTWADHNTNLSITQFYEGSIHPTNPNFALAGSQDNGTEKWTGTNAWQWIYGGDGADNAISSSNPDTHWAVSFWYLSIRRTTDGGASFVVADGGIDDNGPKGRAPFIARFEKCPTDDNVFIAGTDNVWKSTNFFSAASPSWFRNSPDLPRMITALAFAPSGACNIYAFGTSDGQLFLTSNGGGSWTNIDPSNAVPDRWVTDLAFHPTNPNILYVTLSGFDEGTPGKPGHVFKTTNALAAAPTWTNVSPPVDIPHNTIVVDSFNPDVVHVGTDLGVWRSTNGGASWIHMGPETGMPNVAVFELQVNHATNRLVAFTHGRGAFVNIVPPSAPLLRVEPTSLSFSATQGGSNPPAQQLRITNSGGGFLSWSVSDDAPWLTVRRNMPGQETSGVEGPGQTSTPPLDVSVNIAGLSAGTYRANISVTSNGGNANIPVTLAITAVTGPPRLLVGTYSFSARRGGPNPPAQTLSISNDGGQNLVWNVSTNVPWLIVRRNLPGQETSGVEGPGQTATPPPTVQVNIQGLDQGTYIGAILITSNDVNVRIGVILNISP